MKRRRNLRPEALEPRALFAADVADSLNLTQYLEQYQSGLFSTPAAIDGTGNNLANPDFGAANTALLRLAEAEYGDGISTPAGEDRPSAREVSNQLAAQTESTENSRHLSDLLWVWGQFIDHDLDLTEAGEAGEDFSISVPMGDAYFDPSGSGTAEIELTRSDYDETTGDEAGDPRQQINSITAFLDGSVIYGSDEVRAAELREGTGGRLKTSEGDLLPFNTAGLDNAGGTSSTLFLAGDVRANENAALTAMQTVWVREHNRLADEIAAGDPDLSDEEIFQRARAIVRAELQVITYNEFLPALLGENALADYAGYDPTVNPGIANEFSTAAYRIGHSLLSPELERLDENGEVIAAGNLSLQHAFFAPQEIIDNGIDSLLRGLAASTSQELDNQVIDDVRNFLFGPPGSGGFDLTSLNIQRGRDHGLADYNQARVDYGLSPVTSFAEITSDPELQAALEQTYGSVDNIDLWVGGLAEDHAPGSSVGQLFSTIIADQFARIRDGDRFWYENLFAGQALREIESTTLADVIERNTSITGLQQNVFYDPSVLYFKAAPGQQADVRLASKGENLQVVDRRSGEVLVSQAANDVSKVILHGSDRDDRFAIQLGPGVRPVDGVQVLGGGRSDQLEISGTMYHNDLFIVANDHVNANGVNVELDSIELIRLKTQDRSDAWAIADDIVAEVFVERGNTRFTSTAHYAGKRGNENNSPGDGPGGPGSGNANPGNSGPNSGGPSSPGTNGMRPEDVAAMSHFLNEMTGNRLRKEETQALMKSPMLDMLMEVFQTHR
ncbi:peroxidase family protein [Lignipirellula cremea]|uniref:Peroxidase n=1 Tax=Lignipirellula cremea TaxID=2528010 RepID=A0A518DW91_9BACT|nr:peroxidase family protein [Lignipirellula cremea]QDU96105.1 peroxidase [Lignipirellula cremea]